jgi:hypothetical protein
MSLRFRPTWLLPNQPVRAALRLASSPGTVKTSVLFEATEAVISEPLFPSPPPPRRRGQAADQAVARRKLNAIGFAPMGCSETTAPPA